MEIKAIGFDYGGVISQHKSIITSIAQICGIDIDEIKKIYYANNYRANLGSMSYEELWQEILQEIGKAEFYPKVAELFPLFDHVDLNDDVLALVDELRKTYKVGMLSNNTKDNAEKLRNSGLAAHFDSFLVSCDIGYQKPNPKAFELLFKELGAETSEGVFIDDAPTSLSKVEDIGVHGILYKNYEQLVEELRLLGVKI